MLFEPSSTFPFVAECYSKVCEPIALLAGFVDTPFISTGCSSSSLSNKHICPTFSRVVAPWFHIGPVFLLLLEHMNWKRVAIISSTQRAYADIGILLEQTFSDANVVTFRRVSSNVSLLLLLLLRLFPLSGVSGPNS